MASGRAERVGGAVAGTAVGRGWLVNFYDRPVKRTDTAWATMLVDLGIPTGREWRSYVLQHSLATLGLNRAVTG